MSLEYTSQTSVLPSSAGLRPSSSFVFCRLALGFAVAAFLTDLWVAPLEVAFDVAPAPVQAAGLYLTAVSSALNENKIDLL